MGAVIIPAVTGTEYTVYGSVAGLTAYANSSLTWFAAWFAATVDDRARAMVEASKLLDRQAWDGSGVGWPRTGVTALPPSKVPVVDGVTPDEIIDGAYELALAMLAKPAVVAGTSTSSNVQSVGAGSATVSFFSPVTGGRFPDRVMELIGWAFAGSSSSDTIAPMGSYASGTDGCSQFDRRDEYDLSGPA
jgi:hypothetical protein